MDDGVRGVMRRWFLLVASMVLWVGLMPRSVAEELVRLRSFELGVKSWQNYSYNGPWLVEGNGVIFFFADDGWVNEAIFTYEERPALWKSDGTAEGTVMVKENILRLGPASSEEEYEERLGLARVEEMCSVNGMFFFVVRRDTRDEFGQPVEGRSELWRSDGTTAGTFIIKHPEHARWSPKNLTAVDGILYFSAWDGLNGRELWRSDGSEMNTAMVADINPGQNDSNPRHLINASGTLFFSADDGVHGHELWKWEPRGGGGFSGVTEMVKNIVTPGWDLASNPADFMYRRNDLNGISGHLYFRAASKYWLTDGTELGTVEITPGVFNGDLKTIGGEVFRTWPGIFTELNGWVYYAKDDGTSGLELWKNEGNGEVLVKDILPGRSSSNPLGNVNGRASGFLKVNNKIYFIASGSNGQRVWESDGTAAGTVQAFPELASREWDYAAMDGSIFVTTEYSIWVKRSAHLKITPAMPQVDAGGTIVLAAIASGVRTNTVFNSYVWQQKLPGTDEFVTVADTDGYHTEFSTLRIPYVRAELNGTEFRCIASLSNPDVQLQSEPVTLTVVPRPQSVNVSLSGGTFRWTVSGGAGTTYKLQVSTNLLQWDDVSAAPGSGETVDLTDSNSGDPHRFYRVFAE